LNFLSAAWALAVSPMLAARTATPAHAAHLLNWTRRFIGFPPFIVGREPNLLFTPAAEN
jgi:hypothetical protein